MKFNIIIMHLAMLLSLLSHIIVVMILDSHCKSGTVLSLQRWIF